MKCTLETIKNHQWMAGSLAAVGLAAAGTLAHRFGLFALCPKGVSDTCVHVAAVVSKNRFASIVLALAAVGMICLVAAASVRRSKNNHASSTSKAQDTSSSTSLSSQPRHENSSVTPEARIALFGPHYDNAQDIVDFHDYPKAFENSSQRWNPIFGNVIDTKYYNTTHRKMLIEVLDSYLQGKKIPFCEFFDPAYLAIKAEESNQAQSTQFQQAESLSIFEPSLETERMTEYGDLLHAIIEHYYEQAQVNILPNDFFSYRFEVTIGSEKSVSVGHRRLN